MVKFKNRLRRTLAAVLSAGIVLGMVPVTQAAAAGTEQQGYEIYPTPHSTVYQDGDYIMYDEVNVVYESGIDEATQARLEEVAALKNLKVTASESIEDGKTNILVGVDGSGGYADTYADEHYQIATEALFEKTDSYLLVSDNNVITVVGKNTDASFYGLTTLYHIVNQLESYTIRNFQIEDYADVVSRGFIEGYYGNPWSTEDRAALMTWGGYYKLNTYFYAPKDDEKHRTKWDELYTDQELKEKIIPLAEAGNASKCRFAYALHPFPSGNHFRFDTEEHYQEDLAKLKAKFMQVIDCGVRQIAILADDFWSPGGPNGLRLLNDVTQWLETEVKAKYPDMKTTLPYVPYDYMGNGSGSEFTSLKQAPDNVQLVMTGGKVWGEVTDSFTSTFTNNVGRGPFLWINWPCTDNSKKHLIMGGYTTFLHPGVNPNNIQGIMLNPMQQSEPSKVAIFGNACYSWNIWKSEDEANQAWNDSFKYVDHNGSNANSASNALRELSKHMINQNMDGRVTALQESVELKPLLNEYKSKLSAGTVTAEDTDAIIDEFEVLQKAAKTFRDHAGDSRLRDQIVYWLDCWDDTTEAAITYLEGVKSVLNHDTAGIIDANTNGKAAFDRSKTHSFWYVDHYEVAEVGVQHIVPFINTLASYISTQAETIMDPSKVVQSFITNRQDNPVGNTADVFDGDDGTQVSYRSPVWIYTGDYVGVMFNKEIAVNNIRFLLGNGKNHFEQSKLQYTEDGKEWKDLELTGMENSFTGVRDKYLEIIVKKENLPENFQAMGIRLVATANNQLDAYLNVHEITINKQEDSGSEEITGEYSTNLDNMNGAALGKLADSDAGSEVWLSKSSGEFKDQLPADGAVTYTFSEPVFVESVVLEQGGSAAGDVMRDGVIEYLDSEGQWQKAADVTSDKSQTFTLSVTTSAVRVRNETLAPVWWRLGEFRVVASKEDTAPITYTVMHTDRWKVYQGPESNLYDGNEDTFVWYDPDGDGNTTGDDFMVDDFLGYDLGKVATLESARIVVGHDGGDKLLKYAIETSVDNKTWTPVEGYESYTGASSGKDELSINLNGTKARYIRIRNLERRGAWGKFSEFTVKEVPTSGDTEHVYTNIETTMKANLNEEGKAFLTGGNVTFSTGSYIGIKLDNIKKITGIEVSELPQGLKLQTSMNAVTWTDYDPDGDTDARYIRVFNSTASDVECTLSTFIVNYLFIGEKKVTSDFANQSTGSDMRTTGTVGYVFDGDLSTIGMITGFQEVGKQILFDLGQEITFNQVRYYINETNLNYIRHAVFEVSNDPDGDDWTEILTVGNGDFTNVWDDTTAKSASYLTHDTQNPGNMYAEATGLNVSGRYLRVRPLTTYSHRWMGFGEIQINGGAYISPEANRDVVSKAVEVQGKLPSYMLDKDFSTTFQSSEKNSSFTYRISEPQGLRTVRLIQLGAVSNAKVEAAFVGEADKMVLGTLNQSITEFVLPQDKTLESITVSWGEIVPEIAEIQTSTAPVTAADKAELEAELDKGVDENWITDSIAAYKKAETIAKEVLDNDYVSQETVNSALGMLKAARNNAKNKASNLDELQKLVDEALTNEGNLYSAATFADYSEAVDNLKNALENPDNLDTETADELTNTLKLAQDALEYSIRNRELAEIALRKLATVTAEDYTAASYAALTESGNVLSALIAQDKTGDRVNPQEMAEATQAFTAALDGLVDVTDLKAAIAEFDTVDGNLYTDESYTAYIEAVETGKKLLESGTAEEIKAAIKDIKEALAGLEEYVAPDKTLLQKTYDYALTLSTEGVTDSAKKFFTDALAAAQAVLDDNKATQQEVDTAWDNLLNGIWGLGLTQGDKTLLEQLIAKADDMMANSGKYVESNWQQLVEALEKAKDVYDDGDAMEEDVQPAAEALLKAIMAQRYKADKSILQELIEKANKMDVSTYTLESVAVFRAALYNANLVMADETLSVDDQAVVDEAVSQLNAAIENLSADTDSTKPDDGKDDDTEKPSTDDGKGDTPATTKPSGNENTGKPQAPATGDYTNLALWLAAALISMAGAAYLVFQRKKGEQK